MKTNILMGVTPCNSLHKFHRFRPCAASVFRAEDGRSTFFQNVCTKFERRKSLTPGNSSIVVSLNE